MSIPTKKLNNGFELPRVGLGTYKEEKEGALVAAVKAAVKAGYRHFDCAYIYQNENHVGKAIRESIEESNGALKREDFFIVSKLWNIFHRKEKVEEAIDIVLSRLGFDYVDCFLIHWPMAFVEDKGDLPLDENGKTLNLDIPFVETYKSMEELVKKGKTRTLGLSNFNPQQVQEILDSCTIKPICNQFEVNPLLHNNEWVDFCKSKDITVVAFAPLGAPDRAWANKDDPAPLQHPTILELAKKYNKTAGQIILRWLIQRDIVVIPKSVTPSRIEQNAQLFDFELSNEESQIFSTFPEFRFYVFDVSDNHKYYPFKK